MEHTELLVNACTPWQVGVSSSSGSVSVLRLREGGGVEVESEWPAHQLEAWCIAFSRTQVQSGVVIYTKVNKE